MSKEQTSNTKQAAWIAIGSFFSFIVFLKTHMVRALNSSEMK